MFFKKIKGIKGIFKNLSTSGGSLSSKAVKGGFWVFSLRIIDRIFQLIRTIVLARLLSPDDFGLFGIALLVLSMLETFTETGFQHALIQKKGETRSYLDTAWTIGLIRGFTIAAIVFFLAKPASIFFDAPGAEPILKVIGASIIIQSLANIAVLYFQKELEFKKYFKYQFTGTIVDMVVSITSAVLLKSVWALVFGLLAGNLVRCIMSYVIESYKPKIRFNVRQAKELFGFGKWVLGSSILVFLITQGDDILVGKLLGATVLGFYQMAYRISNLPATEITHVISKISFPMYSKLHDEPTELRKAYINMLKLISFISFLITGLILALSTEFTKLFLGENWLPIVPAIQILALAGLSRSIAAISGPVFYGVGKPKIDTIFQIIRLVILIIFIYPFTVKWGITGASFAVLLSIFISNIGFSIGVIKITKCDINTFAKNILIPLVSVLITISPIIYLKNIIYVGFLEFFLLLILAVFIYLILSFVCDKFFKYGIWKLIKNCFGVLEI